MVNVSQTVPYRYACIVCQLFYHRLLEASVFDAVIESAENLCGIRDGLFLTHLGALAVQESHVCAFVECCHFKCASGSGRCFFKQQNDVFALEHFVVDAGSLLCL